MNNFVKRHLGPRESEIPEMLKVVGVKSMEELIEQVIPKSIRLPEEISLPEPVSEYEFLKVIQEIASKNRICRSFIGRGYYGCDMPSVIKRNVFENPGWYTSYTPYQAEISQGRLEALLNFQTLITELTGMQISNCSLLDEATSTAEAMSMMLELRSRQASKEGRNVLFVDKSLFPQTIDTLKLRSEPIGVELVIGDFETVQFSDKMFGAIVQYPSETGEICDYSAFTEKAHQHEILVTAVVDLMSMVLLAPPSEWGADIVTGCTQRFGLPMYFGGPHAGFLATRDDYKRKMPGRIIGVSIDKFGNRALRMALQTREQHIKREKATSNICTAQALLATMSGMYAIYHGPEGLKEIAGRIHSAASIIANGLNNLGYKVNNKNFFDTLHITLPEGIKSCDIQVLANDKNINLFYINEKTLSISTDEVVTVDEVNTLLHIFAKANNKPFTAVTCIENKKAFELKFSRKSDFLQQQVFNSYHSETEMMRYIKKLERRDIALNHSMIPLGSCTMKLNPATSMLPLSWDSFCNIHPFAPADQWKGYKQMIEELEKDLAAITGFASISLMPNSGAAGEHTGLMVIREYHKNNNQAYRNICLIPASAHGTNPASAVMAGMEVVVVNCDDKGNIDVDDLSLKAEQHKDKLAAIMITYPSTHGVFESRILEMIDIVHKNGGQVYMDGANMNAQVGLTNPGFIGADVCHLNLHKTFAIPHGGGGPGVGPIGVASHLVDFLPNHVMMKTGGAKGIHAVASAPYGSAGVLAITYAYIRMMGTAGLKKATEMAILNANYIASSLTGYYKVLFTGETGRCAHEMILDCHNFKERYGVEAADIAHRLMDYGFHAPTLSFPVHETLMVEPTESESKQELDRFIETMKSILAELEDIYTGKADKIDNPVKNSPHTQVECTSDEWNHPYSRQQAAFPLEWIKENKFWPYVAKIDNGFGDRNLVCTCEPIETYMK
ncbi:MAG: aminomethyl-transferring glycine dehydrogenase [Bacteroidales bacterium]|nr:aminomethyl-transferring glycine dehydrogenase [Bacteroidales bacterium]HOY38534.1 aminomethyl-transferring glycine dehydrogenase [Bacteroidales bacterium]HQP03091.1 aminomethyl-transferring glycine dehydrogenase [Bacteroidales bacterium]